MSKLKKIILITIGILVIGISSAFIYYKTTQKTIAILLYDGFTMLDVVGAYQTFMGLQMNGYRMKFVAKSKGMVKSSHIQTLRADYSLDEISDADILFIPSGENIENKLKDADLINWIKKVNKTTSYTLVTGSGSLLLGKTGVLKAKNVASQWFNKNKLEHLGSQYVDKDYVIDGKYYSGKGASASIDMVLELINNIAGEKMSKMTQLFLEYDPHPPVHCGMYSEADSIVKSIANHLVDNTSIKAQNQDKKTIVMFLYKGFTMLDMTGPYQVFKELELLGYEMKFVAKEKGIIPADMILSLNADYSIDEIDTTDILVIPGGSNTADAMMDKDIVNWIKTMNKSTSYSTSVCTGSLLYAKAGLLENKKASTHWYTGQFLKDYGTTYTHQRYTIDGKFITGAGVSSGIDLALLIVKEMVNEDYAKAIQLKISYHPNPPFNAGSPEKSDKDIVEMLSKMYSGSYKKYNKAKEQ